jgi:acyl-CoA reductase-like NAD-dependent aldehyde dehydrogenase
LNSGQICLALKRVFVHEKIYEAFRDKMVEATKALKLGEGFEKDVYLGPIQNSMQYERVKGFFADIDKEKYNVAVGGTNPDGPGYFITPTIIDRPKEDSRIVVEEPFGGLFKRPAQVLDKTDSLCSQARSSHS